MAIQLDPTISITEPRLALRPHGLADERRIRSTDHLLRVGDTTHRHLATVEIVVPVFNEAAGLEASIRRLHDYLSTRFPIPWLVTVADNASTDQTWPIACSMAAELDGVSAVHLDQKGRGRALRAVWSASNSPVVAYMDVDLSTDLDALLPLVAPLVSGHSDVAIGTRLAPNSRVVRGPRREAISRSYNLLLRTTLRSGFSDAQCGFKAVRTEVARTLLPLVEDNGWFFDTELLVLAEANGLRIHEVPVDWTDDPDSRVDVVSTASTDLRGILRMARRMVRGDTRVSAEALRRSGRAGDGLGGQLVRFASIGVVSTIVFGALFALLRPALGAAGADIAALVVCAVANTAANRRLTFSLRGRAGRRRDLGAGVALATLPLAMNLAVLAVMAGFAVTSSTALLVGLTLANGAASLLRFLMLRNWVFAGAGR
jgi:putative flippase GtrA